jgi:hypothetical protein
MRDNSVSGRNCARPYPAGVCLTFPKEGSSGTYKYTGSYHKTLTISGTTYHIIGPYVSWWEAESICESLGLSMPTYNTLKSAFIDTYGRTNTYNWLKSNLVSTAAYNFWVKDNYGSPCEAYQLTVTGALYNKNFASRLLNSHYANNNVYAVCR